MKKLIITAIIAIIAIIVICTSAMAETISVPATETRITILSRNDAIIGVYFNPNVEIDSNDASILRSAGNDVFVVSAAAKGNLNTNRYQRAPRFANGSMNVFSFSGTWLDQEAYDQFEGNAQALIDATKIESKKDGYFSHRLWNRHARPVATVVFEGNLGGRGVRVSYILKDNVRFYGIELLEQTVNTVVRPHVEPTITEEPIETPPVVEPTITEEPIITVEETPAGEGYTTEVVGGRRR